MKYILIAAYLLLSASAYSQSLKKDTRSEIVKADDTDNYQLSQVSTADLLRALDNLGARIFIFKVGPQFAKPYKLKIESEEFLNGKLVNTRDLSPIDNNMYTYWLKENGKDKQYADYISKINFTTREVDTACSVYINIAGNSGGGRLTKHVERHSQMYDWRRYSSTDWKLNTKVPLLVYGSSWWDDKYKIDRFCGATDLSYDKELTKELLDKSPHYYLISYTISE